MKTLKTFHQCAIHNWSAGHLRCGKSHFSPLQPLGGHLGHLPIPVSPRSIMSWGGRASLKCHFQVSDVPVQSCYSSRTHATSGGSTPRRQLLAAVLFFPKQGFLFQPFHTLFPPGGFGKTPRHSSQAEPVHCPDLH